MTSLLRYGAEFSAAVGSLPLAASHRMAKGEIIRTSDSRGVGQPRRSVCALVEAAGVEPASEKVRRAKPTCVSGSVGSAAA